MVEALIRRNRPKCNPKDNLTDLFYEQKNFIYWGNGTFYFDMLCGLTNMVHLSHRI